MKYPGPVRLSNCSGLVRITKVFAAIGENAAVLNQFPAVGLGTVDVPAVIVHLAEAQDGSR